MRVKKKKWIGFGEYPSIHQIEKLRSQVPDSFENKKDLYIYFSTSKGMKRRKLF